MQSRFETEYTSLLPAIRANHSLSQEKGKGQTTPDTFGRILKESLRQLDLFGSSEKMSLDTLPLDSPKFTEAYEIWVIQLRQDFLVRQSAERHTDGNGYLSWRSPHLPTQHASNQSETTYLCRQVKQWPTPRVSDTEGGLSPATQTSTGFRNPRGHGSKLKEAIGLLDQDSPNMNGKNQGWFTPRASDWKGFVKQGKGGMNLMSQTKGKLNPDWVEQLMGLPVGWTDCDYSATESCHSRQKRHLDT